MKKLIFVDTETTGLDPEQDTLVELSYATFNSYSRSPVKTLYFGVESVPPFIDDFIKFTERGIAGKKSSEEEINDFLTLSEGQTMVAANPAFDKAFLVANDLFRFHYRMLDIESYAYRALDTDNMPSMKEIFEELTARGYRLPEPNHTSKRDVEAMLEVYSILKGL